MSVDLKQNLTLGIGRGIIELGGVNMSSYEEKIIKILKKERVKFEREKSFKNLARGKYRYDFYLPNYKGKTCIIEVHGEQHYKRVKKFQKTERDFRAQKERDRRKISYCLAHRIDLYIIPYWDIDKIQSVNDLMNPIYKARSRWHCD